MLTRAVESYLAIRRTLGFQLHNEGLFLQSFALFAEAREEQEISTQTAIDWAGLGTSAPQRARRLGIVIRFAQHLHAEDQRQEVPPSGIFGTQDRTRPVPYIFSPEQIRQIIGLASRLDEAAILLPHT